MPVNVVKTPKDEEKWAKAKELAQKQGQGGNYAYIMGIYQKLKKTLAKGMGLLKQPICGIPGQVPRVDQVIPNRAQVLAPRIEKRPLTDINLSLATPESITGDLGLTRPQRNHWADVISQALACTSAIGARHTLMNAELMGIDKYQRHLMIYRALALFNHSRTLQKGMSRGGKYKRRVALGNGKYKYYYDDAKYEAQHPSGEGSAKQYIQGRLDKALENGAVKVDFFKQFTRKYGAKLIYSLIKDQIKAGKCLWDSKSKQLQKA